MIKKIRVTVDGTPYDVTVEVPDDLPTPTPAQAPPPAQTIDAPPAAAKPAPAPTAGTETGAIPSPLAGHVVGIAVTLGQTVKKGDNLVTIEAMKMNTFVLAPWDGKVAEIKVAVGDAVNEAQVLVRLG